MLLNKDGTVKVLTSEEKAICADGMAAKATKAAIAARVKLLAPLREVLQPIKPFSGRMEQTAHYE